MKKLIFVLTIACFGMRFANAEQVEGWFHGYADGTTAKAEKGAWTQPASGVTIADGAFELDLDATSSLLFTPAANKAPDTNVITRIVSEVMFVPLQTAEPTLTDVKTAFAVKDGQYQARIGSDWVALTGATPGGDFVKVLVEMDYRATTPKVRFGIIVGTTTNFLYAANQSQGDWFTLTEDSRTDRLVTSVSYSGSGIVKDLDGKVQLGVALAGDSPYKYAELQDAINALGQAGGKVTLLRDVDESAEIPANVTVDTNGKEMAGEVTLANGATLETSANDSCIDLSNYTFPSGQDEHVTLKLKDEASTIVNGDIIVATGAKQGQLISIVVDGKNEYKSYNDLTIDGFGNLISTIKTSDAQVNGITFGGATKLAGASNSGLRTFLDTYASSVYNGANSSAANMTDALAADGGNNMPLWQSFVMGINPNTETLATQPTGTDSDTNHIHISIPAVKNVDSGFTVSYKVNETTVSDPKDIQIPVGTGTYTIKAVLTPKAQ